MNEFSGVAAAIASSALGGTSVGATRYLAGTCDPLTIGAFRFGIGFLCLWPVAWTCNVKWPPRSDWPRVAGLGLLFYGLFPILFNASLIYTTAARGALALSTLPLLTLLAGAGLGVEALTLRKSAGVGLAIMGVVMALLSGLASAPPGAWRGDFIMIAAALCMALYNVWSKPFIGRSDPLSFAVMGMGSGAASLTVLAWGTGGFTSVASFDAARWLAIGYLGLFGGAITFFLWAFALGRTTPTCVAVSVAVNPITAALIGTALLGEPVSRSLAAGLIAVLAGIWLAATETAQPRSAA